MASAYYSSNTLHGLMNHGLISSRFPSNSEASTKKYIRFTIICKVWNITALNIEVFYYFVPQVLQFENKYWLCNNNTAI